MNTAKLLQPLLDGGIQSIKFFNGRLLSAEDLQQEQRAQREARELLGLALGDGVVHGLEITRARSAQEPVLRVEAGLAINRNGAPLRLPAAIELSLSDAQQSGAGASSASAAGAGLFRVCSPPATGDFVTGKDLWILTIASAQGTTGKAPVTGLGASAGACNAKHVIDGVRFRARCVTARFNANEFTANEARLRSRVASRCFDSDRALAMARDPFNAPLDPSGTPQRARLVDELRASGSLDDDEVPLAIFYWKAGQGFAFIDRWSVRRRIASRDRGDRWTPSFSDASRAESEAALLQFQEHVDDLLQGSPESVAAVDVFTHLPAVGVLPVLESPRWRGFSVATFFRGLTIRPVGGTIEAAPPTTDAYTVIEGARVRGLLEEALRHDPLSIADAQKSPPEPMEMFWIYQVRENLQAVREAGSTARPYVIFARGSVPYHGDARFDVSRWGYATYS